MQPVGAAVEGQAEAGVGMGPAADAVTGLEHDEAFPRLLQFQPGGEAGSACANDGDVVVAHGFVTRLSVRLMRPPSFSRVEVPASTRSMP